MEIKMDVKKIEKLEELLMDLDVEIGSTITFSDDKVSVLNNMRRANKILNEIKEIFEIEF